MRTIADYIDHRSVLFLTSRSREEALNELVESLVRAKKLKNKEAFLSALLAREKVGSTGIGMGVAIPHAKLPEYKDFFIAVGVHKQGIDWDSLDGAPARLIFVVGGPEGPEKKRTEYLQILSRLTVLLKDVHRREQLLSHENPKEIIKLLDS